MEKLRVLTKEEIEAGLQDLPGWSFANDPTSPQATNGQGKISKKFKFEDFKDSLGFLNQMLPIFEENDHHPDTHIFYNKVLFELQRFDIGGKVTDRDLFMAGEIEKKYQARQP